MVRQTPEEQLEDKQEKVGKLYANIGELAAELSEVAYDMTLLEEQLDKPKYLNAREEYLVQLVKNTILEKGRMSGADAEHIGEAVVTGVRNLQIDIRGAA